MANDQTRPSSDTRAEEQREAQREHTADRPPTEGEAQAAERNAPDPSVAKSFTEAAERGATEKGEGRIP